MPVPRLERSSTCLPVRGELGAEVVHFGPAHPVGRTVLAAAVVNIGTGQSPGHAGCPAAVSPHACAQDGSDAAALVSPASFSAGYG